MALHGFAWLCMALQLHSQANWIQLDVFMRDVQGPLKFHVTVTGLRLFVVAPHGQQQCAGEFLKLAENANGQPASGRALRQRTH